VFVGCFLFIGLLSSLSAFSITLTEAEASFNNVLTAISFLAFTEHTVRAFSLALLITASSLLIWLVSFPFSAQGTFFRRFKIAFFSN
jgi:hypothetical protein